MQVNGRLYGPFVGWDARGEESLNSRFCAGSLRKLCGKMVLESATPNWSSVLEVIAVQGREGRWPLLLALSEEQRRLRHRPITAQAHASSRLSNSVSSKTAVPRPPSQLTRSPSLTILSTTSTSQVPGIENGGLHPSRCQLPSGSQTTCLTTPPAFRIALRTFRFASPA